MATDRFAIMIIIICFLWALLIGIEIVLVNVSASTEMAGQYDSNETMSLERLGLIGRNLTREEALRLNYQESVGYRVTDILDSHPAANAYPVLKKNDTILEVDDRLVNNTFSLESYLHSKKINESLDFTVLRDQNVTRISIQPSPRIYTADGVLSHYSPVDPYYSAMHSLPFSVSYFSDPDTGLILEYDGDNLTKPSQASNYPSVINFDPTNGSHLNRDNFEFSVETRQPYWPITGKDVLLDANDSQEYLNQTHLDFQKLGSNITNVFNDQSIYSLVYSYHDPFEGITNGTLFYPFTSSNKIISITYENARDYFQEWLPLINHTVNSITLLDYKPIVWVDHEVYFRIPSDWQLQSMQPNLINLKVSDRSQFNVTYSDSNSNFSDPCKYNDKESEVKCEFLSRGNFTFILEGPENELNRYSHLMKYISSSFRSKPMDTFPENVLSDNSVKFKGMVTHPFGISYPLSWNFSELLSGIVGKQVQFRPIDTNSTVSLAVSYWNENDVPLAEAYRTYRPGDKSYLVGNFRNSDLTGKEVLYYSGLDTGRPILASTYFLKGVNDSAVTLEYSGYVDEYLEYLPIAKRMIESVRLLEPVDPIEPHGIRVGERPSGISYDENNDMIFVANSGSKSISVINSTDFQVLKFGNHDEIKLDRVRSEPFDLAYDSDNRSLYVIHSTTKPGLFEDVCDSGAITMTQFNRFDQHILKTITLINDTADFCPVDIVIDKNNVAYVGDPFFNKLYVKHPDKNFTDFSLGDNSSSSPGIGLVLDENAQRLYIANPNQGIQFIDLENENYKPESLSLKLAAGSCPIDIGMDRELNRLYIIDANNYCGQIGYSPNNGTLLVVDPSTEEVVETIRLGVSPNNVVVDSKTHNVYVTEMGSDTLTVVDPLTYRATHVKAGVIPTGVTNNPKSGIVYTTSSGSNSVLMINAITNKIDHLVTFKVDPPGSGLIKCEGKHVMLDKLDQYVDNTMCKAEPTKLSSFLFQTWSPDNLPNMIHEFEFESNKSLIMQLIESSDASTGFSARPPTLTANKSLIVQQFLEPFAANKNLIMQLIESSDASTRFPVRTSGTFTANFVESNSLFTQEQLTGLYALAVGLFSTWFVPNLAHRINSERKSRIQNSEFSSYFTALQNPVNDVTDLRKRIVKSLTEGRLSESQYKILDENLSLGDRRKSTGDRSAPDVNQTTSGTNLDASDPNNERPKSSN